MSKHFIILYFLSIIVGIKGYTQNHRFNKVDYLIIAEGTDSPLKDLQLVCFNRYFNLDYLPAEFREKNNLNNKDLYKKKMLIEIFRTDADKKGLDKISLVDIRENDTTLSIEYKLINSDKTNDDQVLSPFLIIQIPKSKKTVKFVVDGIELNKPKNIYLN